MVADTEVAAWPVGFSEAIQLMHAPGGVARSVSGNGTGKFQREIEVAGCAFAVGIDHHQYGLATQQYFSTAVDLRVGALARFHRISRLAEAEIEIEGRAIGQRFFFSSAGAVFDRWLNVFHRGAQLPGAGIGDSSLGDGQS